jgi:hypothetical protein
MFDSTTTPTTVDTTATLTPETLPVTPVETQPTLSVDSPTQPVADAVKPVTKPKPAKKPVKKPAKPAKKALVVASKVVAVKTGKPGRPPLYFGEVKAHIADLIKQHNASHARLILNARPDSNRGKLRNLKLIPRPLGISMPTLLTIAESAGVKLQRGRPRLETSKLLKAA